MSKETKVWGRFMYWIGAVTTAIIACLIDATWPWPVILACCGAVSVGLAMRNG